MCYRLWGLPTHAADAKALTPLRKRFIIRKCGRAPMAGPTLSARESRALLNWDALNWRRYYDVAYILAAYLSTSIRLRQTDMSGWLNNS